MNRLLFCLLVAGALLTPRPSRGVQTVGGWPSLSRGTGDMDPHGAAGPSGILAVCNNGIVYHSKTGAVVWQVIPENGFFLPTICCDAMAVFDPASQRFFVIAQDGDQLNLHVAVSLSANPATGTTNDWRRYKFSTGGATIDYPGIGIDGQALYVAYGNVFQRWFTINKAHLLSGATNATTLQRATASATTYFSQGFQPASLIGSASPGDVAYSVAFMETNSIRLTALTNVLGTQVLFTTNLPAPSIGIPGSVQFAPQPGTTNRLNPGSGLIMGEAFWRDGELWFCAGVASSNQPERSLIRYYKINTGGFPNGQASLAEWGDLDGGSNTWRQHPSISGNARGDVCVVFTQVSSNSFSAIYAAVRKAGQSNFDTVLVKASQTNHTAGTRWADYSVVTADPQDQTFWVSHLTINNPNGTNSLSTWWANVTRDSLFYVDKNAVGSEVGTRELPYHTVRNAHTAVTGAKTLVIKPASYPEPTLPLRLDKNVRLENPYPSGTVHIGP